MINWQKFTTACVKYEKGAYVEVKDESGNVVQYVNYGIYIQEIINATITERHSSIYNRTDYDIKVNNWKKNNFVGTLEQAKELAENKIKEFANLMIKQLQECIS